VCLYSVCVGLAPNLGQPELLLIVDGIRFGMSAGSAFSSEWHGPDKQKALD
jgi:hypothetical protein